MNKAPHRVLPIPTGHRLLQARHGARAITWRITVLHESAGMVRDTTRSCFARADPLDVHPIRFRHGSDINQINHALPGQPVKVRSDCWECLLTAFWAWKMTGFSLLPPAVADACAKAGLGARLLRDGKATRLGVFPEEAA